MLDNMNTPPASLPMPEAGDHEALFESIAQDIDQKGYSIQSGALPADLANLLWQQVQKMPFSRAGIGRGDAHNINNIVRSDAICWITDDTPAGDAWIRWTASLQDFLNRRLFLGLFSFESHFAHYARGDFYKKHRDAFKGDTNRVLSLVTYLNPDWLPEHGGELLLYTGEGRQDIITVAPDFGTLVVFLSEELPHEVLSANRDRYSIAGWFRVNGSNTGRIDPPL